MPKRQPPTDWERVKREAAADAPIDDQSGPYDPNDTAAVSAYWQKATITRGREAPNNRCTFNPH